ncbi:hypothetical protein L3Y34_015100 [Caenorhabditis briggsae]|uniref:Importin N-terminal domain-containing protein n=1 Tax=Caenorhabditis briggsae TaxID=6238 RepID=A0AAE9DV16_CAEBR|nr:hypothetical protein L3Y34_015100 [Caenorhabditis briggsae]ULU11420.1 hypothetical protein L3Y34_015100 [Caenorhabditis briggsae]
MAASTEQAAQQMLTVLEKTVSQNQNDQKQAMDYIAAACQQDFPVFVQCLSMILRTQQCESFVRQAAGLQLKNVLCAKETETRTGYLQRWLQLTTEVREQVKQNVTGTLGTEPSRPSIAAQCVAAIACAELPQNLWPNVIQLLKSNVTEPASGEMLKESSLETLGYICQDIDPRHLEAKANDVLTAIIHGMRPEEGSANVRFAATNALLNSLEFTKTNFDNEAERNIIMQVVCESTNSPDQRVKVASLQCLVRIMQLYYEHMLPYMGSALFQITLGAMKSQEPEVAMQGMEFWSTVAEEEFDLYMAYEDDVERGVENPQCSSRRFMEQAASHVCPVLLEAMAHHDDGDDEDDWTPAKAAGVCLMLAAQCVRDDIVNYVIPFFKHFQNPDWKYKEAAIMAFGSILDGPDPKKLLPMAQEALPAIVAAMCDKNVNVRDTAAWALGRVIDTCSELANNAELLQSVLPALSNGLHQEPRVANNVCWALVSLVKACYESAVANGTDGTGQPETFALSSVFDPMVNELIKITDRADGNQSNLRITAYEALMELIKHSPKDCYSAVRNTTVVILKKLESLLQMESQATSEADKAQVRDLQAMLCATLQSVTRKMQPVDIPAVGEHIMNGLLQIMNRAAATRSNAVMEEALLAVACLAEHLGKGFINYMNVLKPYLLQGLANVDETQVCAAAVGLVTDLSRALEADIMPYMDEMIEKLIFCLQAPKLDRNVKVVIIGTFADIAMAIESNFERYLNTVVPILNDAQNAAVVTDPNDDDQVDYVDRLREACLNSYTGILQGFKASPDIAATRMTVKAFVEPIISLIVRVSSMEPVPPSESLMATTAGIIGDLVGIYEGEIVRFFTSENVNNMLQKGRKSKVGKTKSMANWATKEIKKYTSSGAAGFNFNR